MPIIKGFSTKKDVLAQIAESGAEVTLAVGFSGLKATENPFKDVPTDKLKNRDGEALVIEKENV